MNTCTTTIGIKEFIPYEWVTFETNIKDVAILKTYIDSLFKIDCIIEIIVRINSKLHYSGKIMKVNLKNTTNDFITPITIDFNKKIYYDKDIYNMSLLLSKNEEEVKKNRIKVHFIHNKEVQISINNIFTEINIYFNEIFEEKKMTA